MSQTNVNRMRLYTPITLRCYVGLLIAIVALEREGERERERERERGGRVSELVSE